MKKSKIFVICSLIAAGTTIAGCNTVKGVGQDLESVGQKTSEVADSAK